MDRSVGTAGFTTEQLQQEELVELPPRDLMIAVTVLGIPVVGLTGIEVHIT